MFKVNDREILDSPMSVLERLHSDLLRNGRDLIRELKPSGSNIMFTCPKHNDGAERKPSCGITTEDKGSTPAGTVHCFACGYTTSLDEMISFCFNKEDAGRFGRRWLIQNFLVAERGEGRKPLQVDFVRHKMNVPEALYVTEEELQKYRYIHPYLYKRKMTDEIIEKFDLGYDKKTQCVTFPVLDERGNCLFVARRSVKTKFFNYPPDTQKPVYGMYQILNERCFDEVIVCESMFNALSCWVWGRPAVALLGTGTPYQYEQLKRSPVRKFITAFDPDEGGRKGEERFYKNMKESKILTRFVIPPGKDINDLTEQEFRALEEFFY